MSSSWSSPPVPTPPVWRLGHVRRSFWLVLLAAVALSLAAPIGVLWRASVADLDARACLWPAEPRAGAIAQVVIVIPEGVAPASLTHSTQDMRVVATMPNMAMVPQQAHRAAAPQKIAGSLVLTIPLLVAMPGAWTAQVTLQPPGHAAWRDVITFQAASSTADTWTNPSPSADGAPAAYLCPAEGAQSGGARVMSYMSYQQDQRAAWRPQA